MPQTSIGFSLIELMITMIIISILTALSIPTYQNYIKKAYITSIISETDPIKLAINVCFLTHGNLNDCLTQGENGIPLPPTQEDNQVIQQIQISGNEQRVTINSIPNSHKTGLKADETYQLIGKIENDEIHWTQAGKGYEKYFK